LLLELNEFNPEHFLWTEIKHRRIHMEKINFPYRSETHLPFLHVVAESGSWEKHGLQVDYDKFISSADAHNNVANGSVEFVGGNHLSPYYRRPQGDRWIYLGQTVSLLNHRMVVRPDSGINGVSDLRGKKVASKGQHPGLNPGFLSNRTAC
jgi:ABC-type nitrate/sulfonate/bicarbonate transport system substrate-binding protein